MSEGPVRIRRSRARGWRMPENATYVGRPSRWGNPWYAVGTEVRMQGVTAELVWSRRFTPEDARALTVTTFRRWLDGDYPGAILLRARGAWISEHVGDLAGRDLACWCRPDEPCHADVLLEWANP